MESGGILLVGVGGTATILGCMEAGLVAFDRARLEATRLSAARVSWHLERLWSLPLEERKQIVGLPKNRADVILMGVAIYQAVMEEFGFRELRISTRGLRFAAVMQHGPAVAAAQARRRRTVALLLLDPDLLAGRARCERLRPRNFSMDTFTSRESPGS